MSQPIISTDQAEDADVLDPDTAAALRLAIEHQGAGRLDEARGILDEVLTRQPDNPDALHLLGLVRFAQGQTQEGAALLGRALEKAPDFAVAQGNLSVMLRLMGRAEEGVALLRRALQGKPESAVALPSSRSLTSFQIAALRRAPSTMASRSALDRVNPWILGP